MDKADFEEPSRCQPRPSDRNLIFWVFVSLLGIHTLCLGQQLGYTDDALPILRHTEIVIRHHSFTDPISPAGDYSIYGIGMTLWYLPLRLIGSALIPDDVDPKVTAFYLRVAYIYLNVIATAGTAAVLCAWGLAFGYSRKSSVLGVFCFSLATLAFPYARYDFSEPVTGFFLVTGVFFLWKYRSLGRGSDLLWSGVFFGCGALTRIVVGLAVVPLLAIVGVALKPNSKIKHLSVFLSPLAVALGIVFAYNYGRFGNPFETGYPIDFDTPLLTGIFGLLLSWGRGLVIYSPVGVLGLVLLFVSKRFDVWTKGIVGFLFLFFLVLHGKWSYWYGGWCWGPRLLLPVLAFGGLGLITIFEREEHRRIWATLLFGVGGLINFLAIFIPFSIYYQSALTNGFNEEWLLWRSHYCPLKIQHEMLTQIVLADYDYIWMGAHSWGWPVLGIGLFGAGLAVYGLRKITLIVWRTRAGEDPETAKPPSS